MRSRLGFRFLVVLLAMSHRAYFRTVSPCTEAVSSVDLSTSGGWGAGSLLAMLMLYFLLISSNFGNGPSHPPRCSSERQVRLVPVPAGGAEPLSILLCHPRGIIGPRISTLPPSLPAPLLVFISS